MRAFLLALAVLAACAHAQVHLTDGRTAVARAPFHAQVSLTIFADNPNDGPARPVEQASAEGWSLPKDWKELGAIAIGLIGAIGAAFFA